MILVKFGYSFVEIMKQQQSFCHTIIFHIILFRNCQISLVKFDMASLDLIFQSKLQYPFYILKDFKSKGKNNEKTNMTGSRYHHHHHQRVLQHTKKYEVGPDCFISCDYLHHQVHTHRSILPNFNEQYSMMNRFTLCFLLVSSFILIHLAQGREFIHSKHNYKRQTADCRNVDCKDFDLNSHCEAGECVCDDGFMFNNGVCTLESSILKACKYYSII
jgi:hypothetical protein